MRRIAPFLTLLLGAALLVSALGGCASPSTSDTSGTDGTGAQSDESQQLQGAQVGAAGYIDSASGTYTTGTWYATVKVKGYDPFVIEMNADNAPVTVSNFCNLASNGYYDGLAFYRVVERFCLQGGSAGNTAAAGGDGLAPIVGEFSDNDIDNPLADDFQKGVVAMARTTDPNSATSTFFITLATNDTVSASLDGQYAAFGTIDEAGMATVDKIVADCKGAASSDTGTIADEADMPVIESITVSNSR